MSKQFNGAGVTEVQKNQSDESHIEFLARKYTECKLAYEHAGMMNTAYMTVSQQKESSIAYARLRDEYHSAERKYEAALKARENLTPPVSAPIAVVLEGFHDLILWLNGENGDFKNRPFGEGMFWWRREMMGRYASLVAAPQSSAVPENMQAQVTVEMLVQAAAASLHPEAHDHFEAIDSGSNGEVYSRIVGGINQRISAVPVAAVQRTYCGFTNPIHCNESGCGHIEGMDEPAAVQAQGDALPSLPAPLGTIAVNWGTQSQRDIDGFSGDQMRAYALDYGIKLGRSALQSPPVSEKVAELQQECASVLDNLIDSIQRHGNYSPESTINFLQQARQCLTESSAVLSQPPAVEAPSEQPGALSLTKAEIDALWQEAGDQSFRIQVEQGITGQRLYIFPRLIKAALLARQQSTQPAIKEAPSDKHARLGAYVTAKAAQMGWIVSSGEGAYEFIQRISYSTGWEDGKKEGSGDIHRDNALPASLPKAEAPDQIHAMSVRLHKLGDAAHDQSADGGRYYLGQMDAYHYAARLVRELAPSAAQPAEQTCCHSCTGLGGSDDGKCKECEGTGLVPPRQIVAGVIWPNKADYVKALGDDFFPNAPVVQPAQGTQAVPDWYRWQTRTEDGHFSRDFNKNLRRAYGEPEALYYKPPTPSVLEMVNRFIGWKLPQDFVPDCGISFDGRKDDGWNKSKQWPTGTNLLTAAQAKVMFEYCLAAAPKPPAVRDGEPT